MPSIKIPRGQVLETALLEIPGSGALDLMREISERERCDLPFIYLNIRDGVFDDYLASDRINNCQHCGYPYRDITKNNSSLVCCTDCKRKKDIFLKDLRRQRQRAGDPNRRFSYKELHMTGGEYPFWKSIEHAEMHDMRNGSYCYGDNLEAVAGAAQMRALMGGRRKGPAKVE